MTDVAIVGVGIHPFGRHDGVSGLQQGAVADPAGARRRRARLERRPVRRRRQPRRRQRRHAGQRPRAHRAPVRQRRATAAPPAAARSAIAANAIRSGAYDVGVVVGFDKHPRGAFDRRPGRLGPRRLVRRDRADAHDAVLRDEDPALPARPRLSSGVLAKVAAKAFRNGALNPNAWRRTPLTEDEIVGSTMISHPLTQYMFCSPGEGGVALVVCRADRARRYTCDSPCSSRCGRRCGRGASARSRCSARGSPPRRAPSPTVEAARAAFDRAGIGPDGRRRRPAAGHRIRCRDHAHGRDRPVRARRAGSAARISARPRSAARLPINTDGGCLANGEPVGASGLRQVYESVLQLRGDAGDRQVPCEPQVALTHVYGAPGISACTVLST